MWVLASEGSLNVEFYVHRAEIGLFEHQVQIRIRGRLNDCVQCQGLGFWGLRIENWKFMSLTEGLCVWWLSTPIVQLFHLSSAVSTTIHTILNVSACSFGGLNLSHLQYQRSLLQFSIRPMHCPVSLSLLLTLTPGQKFATWSSNMACW